MTMIERVANALRYEADPSAGATYEQAAVAVLRAMREPTEAMIIDGTNARLNTGLSTYNETPSMWQAMIDAALEEA